MSLYRCCQIWFLRVVRGWRDKLDPEFTFFTRQTYHCKFFSLSVLDFFCGGDVGMGPLEKLLDVIIVHIVRPKRDVYKCFRIAVNKNLTYSAPRSISRPRV